MTLPNNSGVALLMVLIIVTVMTALTVQLSVTVNRQLEAAVSYSDKVQLNTIVRSTLNIVRAALQLDGIENSYDSHFDDWATLEPGILSGLTGGEELKVTVSDLSGLIQVNGLISQEKDPQERKKIEQYHQMLWKRFLMSGGFNIETEEEASKIVAALSDWIDEDDDEREDGAESSYYQSLENPYQCRNNYFTYPEELLLVRGITAEMLYGTPENPGIIKYVTVYNNDGKVNLNTAPAKVIQSMADGIDAEASQALIDFRTDETNQEILAQPGWYKQANFPGDITLDDASLTSTSQYFKLVMSGSHNGFVLEATGVLHRDLENVQTLLYWKVE